MKRRLLITVFMIIGLLLTTGSASAATQKVMWGKTELKAGQIGKITVLSATPIFQSKDKTFERADRTLKKGDEYRVYSYKGQDGGYYGLGGGLFVKKSSAVKYETPSKSKLALLAEQSQAESVGKVYPDGWVAPVLKSKWSSNHAENLKTLQNELGFKNSGMSYSIPEYPEAMNVIGQSPSSSTEVDLTWLFWESNSFPNSYRIPIVSKELFKLYFEEDANRVWNYFNNNEIPEQFTANGRTVKAGFDATTGTVYLQVGRK